ncbi:hypothetical protein [Variovorax boronicumulans]|uniref:hypothetical protein n=1 Tax=Variovorax boronicumulans TaxID=436515 RepID=UPI00214C07E0
MFTVRVLGFGNEPLGGAAAPDSRGADAGGAYDARSPVQVLGRGPLGEAQKAMLTAAERRNWRP